MLQGDRVPDLPKVTKYDNSVNTLQLLNNFLLLSMEEKVELLKRLGRGELSVTEIEIPVGVLGNIVEALKDITEIHTNSIDVANVIEVLITSKRWVYLCYTSFIKYIVFCSYRTLNIQYTG